MNLDGVRINHQGLGYNSYTNISRQTNNSEPPNISHGVNKKNHFVHGNSGRMDKLKEVYDDKTLKKMGVIECSSCASRRYVDGSNDPHVSFKTPTHVSPEASVAAVTSHEMEHVSHEQNSAKSEGGKVIGQSVSIFMAVCPECGVSFASGGVTRTTVSKPVENEQDKGHLVDLKL